MAKAQEKQATVEKIKHRFVFFKNKSIRYTVLIVAGVIVLFLVFFGIYSVAYSHKSFANVRVGDIELGGMKKQDIESILKNKSDEFLGKEIVLNYEGDNPVEYKITPKEIGLAYDTDASVANIIGFGRNGGIIGDFWEQLKSLFADQNVGMAYSVNEDVVQSKIAEIAGKTDQPEKDYTIEYKDNKFELNSDRHEGKRINQSGLINNVKYLISNVKSNPISFKSEKFIPTATLENANKRLSDANKIISGGELNLYFKDQEFNLDPDTIGGMVSARPKGNDLEIYLVENRVSTQITNIADAINTEPQNAELQASGGSVSAFKVSRDGQKLDESQTKVDIQNALLGRVYSVAGEVDTSKISLKVSITKPEVNSDEISKYGLKELVASGVTSFARSPSNRIHNITVGAAAINGTLIKPGETFSTLGRLGKIDSSTGYLPELVIKENRTVPEFGGGLCQVSTTLFRAALNAGMEIVERQNHKYRVSYYEPPVGMDATIYDPAPDFKFKNNYDSYILIQAQVVGTKITFQFYGTKDSRVVSIGTPSLYDVVSPPAPLEIPTDTLAAGERQKIDSGHPGATASFHYKVTRESVVLQEKDFLSKYVPWQEKWLVGAAPAAPAPAPEPTPAPTSEPTPAPEPPTDPAVPPTP